MQQPRCTACSQPPRIRINNLDYCDTCFDTQFLHKALGHFRKLPLGTRILLYLDGKSPSLAMAHAVSRLKNRNIHTFAVASSHCQQHRDFLCSIGFSTVVDVGVGEGPCSGSRADPLPSHVLKTATSLGFDMVVFQASAEAESVLALGSICRGAGAAESVEHHVSSTGRCKAKNALGRVRAKEIGYYCYLNREAIPRGIPSRMSGTDLVLSRFVRRMDSKNSLAVFNILNTVKKIVSGRDGIDASD